MNEIIYPSDIIKLKVCLGKQCVTLHGPKGCTKRYTQFSLDPTSPDRLSSICLDCQRYEKALAEAPKKQMIEDLKEDEVEDELESEAGTTDLSSLYERNAILLPQGKRICNSPGCSSLGNPISLDKFIHAHLSRDGYALTCQECRARHRAENRRKKAEKEAKEKAKIVESLPQLEGKVDAPAIPPRADLPRTSTVDPRFSHFNGVFKQRLSSCSDLQLVMEALKHIVLMACENDALTQILVEELDYRTNK